MNIAKRGFLAALAAVASLQTFSADEKGMDLYLLVGQSNMSGRGILTDENRVDADRIFKLDAAGKWQRAVEPIHFDKKVAGAGLAASFARAMADKDKDVKIGLIPCSVGGTRIDRWIESGDLWSNAVKRTRIALKDGTLRGILWHQGEGDATPRRAPQWGAKFKSMVASFRREFGDLPFVAGELGHYLEGFRERNGKKLRWKEINAQLHGLVGKIRSYCVVSAEGLKANRDRLHFNTEALREFGRRYAAAMTLAAGAAEASTVPELSILVFGHSFGVDSTEHLPALLDAAGIKTVHIGRFTKANCSLQERWDFLVTGAPKGVNGMPNIYQESAPGEKGWKRRAATMKQVLDARAWDYVVIQNSLENEGLYGPGTAQPYLNDIVAYVRKNAKEKFGREPEICWNMFWPMSDLCRNSKSPTLLKRMNTYGNSSQKMWEAYMKATKEMMADTGITNVVPTGTAIMRLRATPLNTPAMKEFTCDGYHLSKGVGRYTASCVFFEHFIAPKFGVSVVGNSLRLPKLSTPVTDENARLLQECAHEAERHPFGP